MNAAHTEHVLIFQIASVAPSVDFHGNHVLARLDILRDTELGIVVRSLRIADTLSVYPDIGRTIDAIEVKENFFSFPICRKRKVATV